MRGMKCRQGHPSHRHHSLRKISSVAVTYARYHGSLRALVSHQDVSKGASVRSIYFPLRLGGLSMPRHVKGEWAQGRGRAASRVRVARSGRYMGAVDVEKMSHVNDTARYAQSKPSRHGIQCSMPEKHRSPIRKIVGDDRWVLVNDTKASIHLPPSKLPFPHTSHLSLAFPLHDTDRPFHRPTFL